LRITKHTDYGLRVLLFLGVRPEERVPTQTIADAYGISHSHLQKIVRALAGLDLVRLHRGADGGVELAQAPNEISVGAVMRGLDEQDALIECFQPETDTCVVSSSCGLKASLRVAQEAFYASLDPLTIGAVIKRRASRLRDLTGG
jgi:Rrf2 family nitric oxide-sensitive transcriptional repressor